MAETNSQILAELVEDYSNRLRNDDTPTVAEYVDRYPELEDDIRKLFRPLQAMETLSERETTERKFERKTKRLMVTPDGLLGDFRIIREIGRGGMGVVYEAEQQSLKRRVALKILGPTMAGSPRQLARFQSEAKAVAQLHHTNIVSVYGVGEHDGLYYYAMQLIVGMTVSEAIALDDGTDSATFAGSLTGRVNVDPDMTRTFAGMIEDLNPAGATTDGGQPNDSGPSLPAVPKHLNEINRSLHSASRWMEIARLGACVADALDYAHTNGVWHRDIKPSNLIIDGQGVVWLTDFGLAQHENRDAVTATGDIVGTLRYMAPEQFSGQFDGRCDTYSLGMTIYEMLTLRPAFTEIRHGPLINQKTTSSPPTPRSLNPKIPRDLETIVLKAVAVNPDNRYERPADLAKDLRRFIEDRPIMARRVTYRERVYRWAKRNPLAATLGLISLLSILSVFIVAARKNLELRAETAKVRTKERARNMEALRNGALVALLSDVSAFERQFVERCRTRIQQRGLPEPLRLEIGPSVAHLISDADREFMVDRIRHTREFVGKEFASKPGITEIVPVMIADNGEMNERLGLYNEAICDYTNALSLFQFQVDRKNLLHQINVARMHASLGRVLALVGAAKISDEAAKAYVRYENDLSLAESGYRGADAAVHFLDTFPDPNQLSYDSVRLEFVRSIHSQVIVRLMNRGHGQMVGAEIEPNPGSWGEEVASLERAAELLAPLLVRERPEYSLMNVRLQADRAKLAMLRGDDANVRLHFTNAVTVLSKMIVDAEQQQLRQGMTSSNQRLLRLELAYLLLLAKDLEPNSVSKTEARRCLSMLAQEMGDFALLRRSEKHVAVLAEAARKRLAQLELASSPE